MVGGPNWVEHFDHYPIAEVTEDEIQGFLPSSRTVNMLLKIMGGRSLLPGTHQQALFLSFPAMTRCVS